MIENLIAIDVLEKVEADLRYGNTDRAIENIDKILNNKIYYLMVEYKKIQEKYGKDSEKAKKIEKKINKEMNNVLYGKN